MLLLLIAYIVIGMMLIGVKVYVEKLEGVTPEFKAWWVKFHKRYEILDPYNYIDKHSPSAPHPRPKFRPYTLYRIFSKPSIALGWPILLIGAVILLTGWLIKVAVGGFLNNIYTVYPEKIAAAIEKQVNSWRGE